LLSRYRTYVEPDQPVSDEDEQIVERAIAAAKRRNPAMEESILVFCATCCCFVRLKISIAAGRAAYTHFILKFQQTTAPVMAKGLEDTMFYIYNRLPALNEVGGEPQQFGLGVEVFHERNLDRQRDWPATLLATSTHDTKRSEDVRARIVAISEIPELWRRSLQRWGTANHPLEQDGELIWRRRIRTKNICFNQTLLGTWPMQANGEPEPCAGSVSTSNGSKLTLQGASKKRSSTPSWIQPNEEWDAAMHDFVARILDSSSRNKFLPIFPACGERDCSGSGRSIRLPKPC